MAESANFDPQFPFRSFKNLFVLNSMQWINRQKLTLGIAFLGLFLGYFVVSLHHDSNQEHILYGLMDFEDTSEKGEDHESKNKKEDCRYERQIPISTKGIYLSTCLKYGQLDFDHALEVFLEIVTPPPEA